MLVVVHDWVGVDPEVEQFDGAITAGGKELVLVDFGPCQVVQCIVRVEAENLLAVATRNRMNQSILSKDADTHVFSTWMPAAVRPSANRRPLPTMPKLAAEATATRLS